MPIFLLWCCVSAFAAGPPVRFQYLTIEDGLSQGSVQAVYQDASGFLWFGTQDGLNRYDGYQFRVFRNDPTDPGSLAGNYIKKIVGDDQGRLWMAVSYDGVSCFDPETESFRSWRQGPAPDGLPGDKTTSLLVHAGRVWAGFQGGGLAAFEGDGRVVHYSDGRPGGSVLDMVAADERSLWLATDQGVTRFSLTDGQPFEPIDLPGGPAPVHALLLDAQGRLWAGAKDGRLLRYLPNEGRFEVLAHLDDPIHALGWGQMEQMWVGTRGGGLYWVNERDEVAPLVFESLGERSLEIGAVWCITQDQAGLIWVGTALGAAVYNPATSHFDVYRHRADRTDTLSSDFVSVLSGDARDPNLVWVGSYSSGLCRLNQATREVLRLPVNTGDQRGLSFEYVSALHDQADQLWVGTFGGGLHVLDKDKLLFTRIPPDPNDAHAPGGDRITWIQPDPGDVEVLWLGYDGNGVDRYHLKHGVDQRLRHQPDDPAGLASNQIVTMLFDSRERLWIGSNDAGLDRLEADGTVRHFPAQVGGATGPSHKRITSILELNGALWLGTYGGGLNRLDLATDSFKVWRTADGLPNDTVYGVLADKRGRIWFSTNAGLGCLDPADNSVKSFTVHDGIQGMEFNQKSCVQTAPGRLFFGGTHGLTAFFPDQVVDDPHPPPVRLTAFRVYHEPMRPGDPRMSQPLEAAAPFVKRIVLTHEEPVFSFEFAALHYAAPDKNRYSYRLEGFDRAWIETDARRRFAAYTNLPAGAYRFRVKAANQDGVWNEQGTAVDLEVLPLPFFDRWAKALIFGALFLLALVGLVYKRLADAKCRLERKVAERTAALAAKTEELEKRNQELLQTRQSVVLQEKMASLGMVAAGLAHEVNNPAGFAHGSAQALSKELDGFRDFLLHLAGDDAEPEIIQALEQKLHPLFENAARVVEGTSRIIELVRDVRASSRTDRTDRIVADLNRGLRTTVSLVRPNFKHAVSFELETADELNVLCWPNQLNQVFMNLLVNACHAVERQQDIMEDENPRRVVVRSFAEGDWAVIEIFDEGCGMPPEVVSKIFEPFFTTKGDKTGTGLGLAISRDIISKHDGDIEVQSSVGKGTTFSIRLPRRSP